MTQVNFPMNMLEVLDGAPFPATSPELVAYAEERDASEDVLDQLQAMPDRIYLSIKDVSRYLGLIEPLPGSENLWASEPEDEFPDDDDANDEIVTERGAL